MFGRVSHIFGIPEQLETAVPMLQEGVDQVQGLPGFEGAYLLVDREGGKIMTLTFWNNASDLKSSAPVAEGILARAAERAGASTPAQTQTYEVLLEI